MGAEAPAGAATSAARGAATPAAKKGMLTLPSHSAAYSEGVRSLAALQPIAIVGEGACALVAIVRHRESGEVFALKRMARKKITGKHARRQVCAE